MEPERQKKKYDSQSEIVCQKKDQIQEGVRHICLQENPNTAQQAVGNHQRVDRPILKIKPKIDQIIHGLPEFQVEQDPTRRDIIPNLTPQVLQSPKREKLVEELSPQDGENSHPMSEETKNIIVEKRNIEAFESTKLAVKMQCARSHKYMSAAFFTVIVVEIFQVPTRTNSQECHQNFDLLATFAFKSEKTITWK